MSIEILKNNLPYIQGLIDGQEIEFRMYPEAKWEPFTYDFNTLDLFDRYKDFRFKQ